MRMEYLMARLMVPLTQAIAKEPNKVKFRDYLRYHDTEEEDQVTDMDLTPEAFAAMFGAVKRKTG